jgi:HEAT repeat protein
MIPAKRSFFFSLIFSLIVGVADGRCFPQETASVQDANIQSQIARLGGREWALAVEELVKIGPPAVPDLVAAYKIGERHVSARAVLALGRIGTSEAVEIVYEAARNPDSAVRENAIRALGALPGPRSVAALIEILGGEGETGRNMSAAAQTLGRLRAGEAVDSLLAAMRSEHWYVRMAVAEALARIGEVRSVAPLMTFLKDPDGQVRRRLRVSLLAFGEPADAVFVESLGDRNPDIRWQAAWIIRHRIPMLFGGGPFVDALKAQDWRVRNEAALFLVALDEELRPISRLKELLKNPRKEVRQEAGWIMEGWKSHKPVSVPETAAAAASRPAGIAAAPAQLPPLYPTLLKARPDIPSPCLTPDGRELVLARTSKGEWGVIPVTLESSERKGRQLYIDGGDFPTLAVTGLHSVPELDRTHSITGRSISEITDLARPDGLSVEGFLAEDEDIISVLKGDNDLVSRLGLTHPRLARPLFHIWNMILTDLDLGRWDMASHRWKNIEALASNGRTVLLNAGDTKGGQESIFDDGLDGAFWIEIRRDLTPQEEAFLSEKYRSLTAEKMEEFRKKLTHVQTGEMEPYYIMWYGFYEGHTPWRADPIALAFIFGLKSLEDIEKAFPGRLYDVLTEHFKRDS